MLKELAVLSLPLFLIYAFYLIQRNNERLRIKITSLEMSRGVHWEYMKTSCNRIDIINARMERIADELEAIHNDVGKLHLADRKLEAELAATDEALATVEQDYTALHLDKMQRIVDEGSW